jgi:hypothetical protein
MEIDNAVVNRQGEALFNFWLKKRQNDKRVGELTVGDFVETCRFLAEMKTKDAANKNQKRKERQMRQVNDNFKEVLKNGEPRSVIDEYCQQLGIPNIPEYVDAVDDFGEKRLVVLSVAGVHFLTDKRLKELPKKSPQKAKVNRFKNHINTTMGKRGELRIFKTKTGDKQ